MRVLCITSVFIICIIFSPLLFAKTSYGVEIRIISASMNGNHIDQTLRPLIKDLKSMPFKKYKQLDYIKRRLSENETISINFPGKKRRTFKVTSKGFINNSLNLELQISALSFKTSVKIPSNGTLIVGGPKIDGGIILFYITARNL